MFKNKILKSKKQKIRKSKTRKRIKGGANVNNTTGNGANDKAAGIGSKLINAAGKAIGSVRSVTRRVTDPLNRAKYLTYRAMGYNGNPAWYDYNSSRRAAANSKTNTNFHEGYVKRLVDLLNEEQREIYDKLYKNMGKIRSILDELIEKGGNKIKIDSLYEKFEKERLFYDKMIFLVDISKLPNLYSIVVSTIKDQHNPLHNEK